MRLLLIRGCRRCGVFLLAPLDPLELVIYDIINPVLNYKVAHFRTVV